MRKRVGAAILTVVMGCLLLAGSAAAATIADLPGLGYTVTISNPGPAGANCPTYFVSGHGVQTYVNCNTPQAEIDSLANPLVICNADWQIKHPDQLQALESITGKGWGISGDQCADVYTITNPNDGTAAYSGSGAGLPAFDAAHGAPPVAQTATPGTVSAAPTTCLPLCPNPGDTRGGGGTVVPAPVTATSDAIVSSGETAPYRLPLAGAVTLV